MYLFLFKQPKLMWFSFFSLQILFVSRQGRGGELEDVPSTWVPARRKRRLEGALRALRIGEVVCRSEEDP